MKRKFRGSKRTKCSILITSPITYWLCKGRNRDEKNKKRPIEISSEQMAKINFATTENYHLHDTCL